LSGKTAGLTGGRIYGNSNIVLYKAWRCKEMRGAEKLEAKNKVTVETSFHGRKIAVPFMIFGPKEAKGWAIAENVKKCRKCNARIEKCIC
jgi:hypothetical protein